jgi:hypothetical protein
MRVTQYLTEIGTSDRNKHFPLEAEIGWCVRLVTSPPPLSRLSTQCGIINISQPCRPPWPVTPSDVVNTDCINISNLIHSHFYVIYGTLHVGGRTNTNEQIYENYCYCPSVKNVKRVWCSTKIVSILRQRHTAG